jgi:hypothetical protein
MAEKTKFDASEIVNLAAEEAVQEEKRNRVSRIRKLFLKIEQLQIDVKMDKDKLAKKEAKLKVNLDLMDKLKAGDWSVLSTLEQQNNQKEEKKED